jgi:hypothetical protein
MPKHSTSANAVRLPALTRRGFLTGSAAATRAPTQVAATRADAELTALGRQFEQALETYAAAQRRFNDCEARYFDLKPPRPAALTQQGPLGHLIELDRDYWTARELRVLLGDPDSHADRVAACAVLPVARAYEARLRRLSRTIGLTDAEAAYRAAGDALCDLSTRVADRPARSLGDLAVKARVVKYYAAPDWWCDSDTPERIAAQVFDAVMEIAERQVAI